MRGYNLHDDQVKTLVYLSLTGQDDTDILKQACIKTGMDMTKVFIKRIPRYTLTQINKRVGFRLVMKFGEKRCDKYR